MGVMSEKTSRNFTDKGGRLVSRSLEEIRDGMDRETTRVLRTYSPEVGPQGFNLTSAVNAVVAGYLRLPQDVRDRIILDGARECQRLLCRESPDTEAFIEVDSKNRDRSHGARVDGFGVRLVPAPSPEILDLPSDPGGTFAQRRAVGDGGEKAAKRSGRPKGAKS